MSEKCTGGGLCYLGLQCTSKKGKHRFHFDYCPSTCQYNCELYKCSKSYCNKCLPKIILNAHGGMCVNCAIQDYASRN